MTISLDQLSEEDRATLFRQAAAMVPQAVPVANAGGQGAEAREAWMDHVVQPVDTGWTRWEGDEKPEPDDDGLDDALDDEPENVAVQQVEASRAVKPEGMPGVLPMHVLPRRKRAAMARALGELQVSTKALDAFSKAGANPGESEKEFSLRLYAEAMEFYGQIETFLISVTDSPAEMTHWLQNVEEDSVLLDALAWYSAEYRPGEASGSQTS